MFSQSHWKLQLNLFDLMTSYMWHHPLVRSVKCGFKPTINVFFYFEHQTACVPYLNTLISPIKTDFGFYSLNANWEQKLTTAQLEITNYPQNYVFKLMLHDPDGILYLWPHTNRFVVQQAHWPISCKLPDCKTWMERCWHSDKQTGLITSTHLQVVSMVTGVTLLSFEMLPLILFSCSIFTPQDKTTEWTCRTRRDLGSCDFLPGSDWTGYQGEPGSQRVKQSI